MASVCARRCVIVTIARAPHRAFAVGACLLLTVGCSGTPSRWGPAHVEFDGVHVGTGGTHVTCEGTTQPDVVVHLDRSLAMYEEDWYPADRGGGQARLRLELTHGSPPARIEFSLGKAVYRSNDATAMTVDAGWSGHATFSDLPLVSGEGYGGRDAIGLLDIEWNCLVKN